MKNHESESDIIQIQLRTQAVIYLILAVTQSLFALIFSLHVPTTCTHIIHTLTDNLTHTHFSKTHFLFIFATKFQVPVHKGKMTVQ